MARSSTSEIRRAIGEMQRLCCLGLDAGSFMSALMPVLQKIVPTSNRYLFRAGCDLQLANAYFEGPCIGCVQLYLSEFYDMREKDAYVTFPEAMRTRFGGAVTDMKCLKKVDDRRLLRTDFYNLLLRPAGMDHGIYVHLTAGSRPVGALCLWRSVNEPAFSRRDYAILEALRGFVAHGLHDGPGVQHFVDSDDRALIVADREGRPLHLSPEARRLLLMAFVPRWAPSTALRMRPGEIPELAGIAKTVAAATFDRLPRQPPIVRKRNAWGEFVLRAYFLDTMDSRESSRFIGMTIERREPAPVGLLRRIEGLPISDREKQLCLLLGQGHDMGSAAREMGVTENTLVTHRRRLYGKLSVSSRMELVERLRG
jgi:DNA-binding CsgD family transcriptional regulator